MSHSKKMSPLAAKDFTVGVVGLGYVGLPLVVEFAAAGFRVLGFDSDPEKVAHLKRGESYIRHIDPAAIARANAARFEATSDMQRARECNAVLVCVPTPLTEQREPDLQFVVASMEALAPHMRPGSLVVLESTTYPGTTDEIVRPIFERHGLRPGVDIFLAYSPEREDPNNPDFSTRTIPKIVGADHPRALEAACELYDAIVDRVVPVRSSRVAEAAKILENTFRSVNIALVNELKVLFTRMGIDVWDVVDAAATKPFGFMRFAPGPGVGGHCIPVDPFYLTWKAREFDLATRFIEMAGEVNRAMPHYIVERTMEAFSDRGLGLAGKRLLVVGMAYKKNVDDARESPSYRVVELFEARKVTIDYHDDFLPVIPPSRQHGGLAGRASIPLSRASEYDGVVLLTDHDYIDYPALLERARVLIDARGRYREPNAKVVKA